MTESVAQAKLSPFHKEGVRARIYRVAAVFAEGGLAPEEAVRSMLGACEPGPGTAGRSIPEARRALRDALAGVVARLDGGKTFAEAISGAFPNLSVEETAILSVLDRVSPPSLARILDRAADIAASFQAQR